MLFEQAFIDVYKLGWFSFQTLLNKQNLPTLETHLGGHDQGPHMRVLAPPALTLKTGWVAKRPSDPRIPMLGPK